MQDECSEMSLIIYTEFHIYWLCNREMKTVPRVNPQAKKLYFGEKCSDFFWYVLASIMKKPTLKVDHQRTSKRSFHFTWTILISWKSYHIFRSNRSWVKIWCEVVRNVNPRGHAISQSSFLSIGNQIHLDGNADWTTSLFPSADFPYESKTNFEVFSTIWPMPKIG